MVKKFSLLRIVLPVLILFFISHNSAAQFATIRGFVYESESGEPVIFTNVYLYKTSMGAATDINGYFAITRIPPGQYTLMVSYMGFDTLRMPLTLRANDLITKKIYLVKSMFNLEEISISAARQDKKVETQTSIIKISPRDIQQIPSIGGQPDLAQYLQVLPGVIFSGDQGGQLYIRGGPPVQNKVLLDGMVIYNPFHSIGLFSVFDVDILKNVDVFTGGFGAEFGGRISSIMDITTRDGNKNRIAGKIDASTFGAKLLLEGPIAKAKTEDGTSTSFILSVKNSYLKESSKLLYTYIDKNGLPYNYFDTYGKISINAANGSKVNFFGFNFTDKVQYQILNNFNWNSYGGGMNFVVIPGESPVLIEGTLAYSNFKVSLTEAGNSQSSGSIGATNSPRTSSIGGFNAGFNFTHFFGKNSLKYGLEISGYQTNYHFSNPVKREIDLTQNTTEPSVYVKYKWTIGKFVIEPGYRFQFYASLWEISQEPRLAVKYNLFNHFRLKMAAGLYSQNLISTTDEYDVVSLFSGYITSRDDLSDYTGKNVKSKIQKSDQVVLGFELDLSRNIFLNVEGYYKYYPQLTTINRYNISDQSKDFVIERGDAKGVDVSLRYDINRFHIWAVYSLCYVNMNDGISEYVPTYDRRHNVNLTSSFLFGKHMRWELDARWNYGSGFPFTQTAGYYEQLNFQNIGSDYINENGQLGIIYASFNGGRLSYYSRVDINLKRTFVFGKKKNDKVEITAGVTNALNEKNIFYVDRITNNRIYQLPLMPSVGISFSF